MIASRENSFPSEPFSRGDRCLPRVVELETASSAGILVRIAALLRMAFLLALSPAPWSTRRGRGAHCMAGPFFKSAYRAMFEYGFSPPRIVNSAVVLQASACAEWC